MRATRPYEDFSNLLLMLLKFLLIVAISLQGLRSIVTQLGLNPETKTGIVNATPTSQPTVDADGSFRLAFYPVIYAVALDLSEVNVEARLCSENCDVNWGEVELEKRLPQGAQWLDLGTRNFTFNRVDQTPEEAARTLSERLHSEHYSLRDLDQVPGTYSVIYLVQFVEADEVHPVPQVFTVNYLSTEELEWRLDPIRIVKGQSAPLPNSLDGFQLSAPQDSKLRIQDNRVSLVRSNYEGEDFLEQALHVETQVGSVITATNSFVVGGVTIQAGQARFARYDPSSATFVRSEFREMQTGHRVYYEASPVGGNPQQQGPLEASLVRFSSEQLPVTVPVLAVDNLRPRGISGSRVFLYFPQHAYVQGGQFYFDLSQHVYDPDTARTDRPWASMTYGKRGDWHDLDLVRGAAGEPNLTFNPTTLVNYLNSQGELDLSLSVNDDGRQWHSAANIRLTIKVFPREALSVFLRYLPSIEGTQ